jgi:hypothetical protein
MLIGRGAITRTVSPRIELRLWARSLQNALQRDQTSVVN